MKNYAIKYVHLFVNEIVDVLRNANSQTTFRSGLAGHEWWIQYDSTTETDYIQQIKMRFPQGIVTNSDMNITQRDVTISTDKFRKI